MLHVFMASRAWKRKLEQGDIGAARKLTEQKTFLGKKHAGHLRTVCMFSTEVTVACPGRVAVDGLGSNGIPLCFESRVGGQ